MSSFDERKKGFEKKFAHDEEKQFKINAKKNKYLGEWASQILGVWVTLVLMQRTWLSMLLEKKLRDCYLK